MFTFVVIAVIARQCYQCLSPHSFEDCDAKRVKITCPDSQHCVSVSAFSTSGLKDEEYVRGCAATCSASDIHVCNHSNVTCKISCCSSDYCNAKQTSTPVPKSTFPGPAPVYSRKCYQCLSTHSFEDCDAKRIKVTCLRSQSCVTASAIMTSGIKEKAYAKGCANTCSASKVPVCNDPNVTCEVSCCSSDYCNGYLPTTAPPKQPLQCFECLSNRSFEDCDARRTNVTCKSSQPCLKATVISTSGVKLQAYGKGCAPGCSVSDLPFCREPNITCELSCCSSDYCNGYLPTTSAPSISSSVLWSADSRLLFMVIGVMYMCASRMFKRLLV